MGLATGSKQAGPTEVLRSVVPRGDVTRRPRGVRGTRAQSEAPSGAWGVGGPSRVCPLC